MSPNEYSRRAFMGTIAGGMAALSAAAESGQQKEMPASQLPNILFVMTDQQRFDTIAALGNTGIYTPNLDRLVRRGLSFTRAYSTCPVCVASRYTIRTGRREPVTGIYANMRPDLVAGQPEAMEERCGPYLARTLRSRGYRTFGIGKFHASPWDEDLGYDVHLHSEELYGSPEHRSRDAYAAFIAREHPEYDFIECLMGERTEMYYMPQMSPPLWAWRPGLLTGRWNRSGFRVRNLTSGSSPLWGPTRPWRRPSHSTACTIPTACQILYAAPRTSIIWTNRFPG